ncbi:MAG: F0F1 ATP synthase subunit B [Candidatus Saccharimonadales bacterium]
MFSLVQNFGSSTGLGALGLSASAFVIQLITFIIALLVLRKWAFKPIMKILNERREAIEKGVSLGELMQKEKDELEAKVNHTLTQTRQKADKILSDATSTARQMVRDAEDQARTKAEGIVKDGAERGVLETKRAWRKLEGQLAGLVTDATEAVIGEKVDQSKDSELINRALKERIKA